MNGNGPYQPGSPGQDNYSDLDGWGQHAAPQHAFRPNLDTVANGDYDCEVESAALDKVNNNRIVRVALRLTNAGGRTIEHTYWLNRQEGVNGFMAEMAALNFAAQTWGTGPGKIPLSQAIPHCVAQLKGIRFRATKSSRHVAAKPAGAGQAAKEAATYHELHIGGRIGGVPMPPGVTQAAAQAMQESRQPALANAGTDEDLPF